MNRIVPDLPELEYHALPGIASTGIKRLLQAPARYQWDAEHPEHSDAFDLGHAVHARVLGVGLDVVVVDAPSWRTKAAQAARDEARDRGAVALLAEDDARVQAMTDAVLAHPDAGPLFTGGQPEVSLLWADAETGVECRGRLDYWHPGARVAVDLKTTSRSAHPGAVARAAADFGWHTQAAHYSDGVEQITGARPRFLHVVVETRPPHLLSVIELDDEYLALGAADVRTALTLYARCSEADEWPGYPTGIHPVEAPRWLTTTLADVA